MMNLCSTLLPIDRVHAIPADIGKTIKPIPVIDRVIEVDVAPIITIVSTVSKNEVSVLYFFYLFFDLWFFSLKYVIIFNVVNMVIKTINIIHFLFQSLF